MINQQGEGRLEEKQKDETFDSGRTYIINGVCRDALDKALALYAKGDRFDPQPGHRGVGQILLLATCLIIP